MIFTDGTATYDIELTESPMDAQDFGEDKSAGLFNMLYDLRYDDDIQGYILPRESSMQDLVHEALRWQDFQDVATKQYIRDYCGSPFYYPDPSDIHVRVSKIKKSNIPEIKKSQIKGVYAVEACVSQALKNESFSPDGWRNAIRNALKTEDTQNLLSYANSFMEWGKLSQLCAIEELANRTGVKRKKGQSIKEVFSNVKKALSSQKQVAQQRISAQPPKSL